VHNVYPGTKKLIDIWSRIHRLYGPVRIDISGGEPFLYPEFPAFLLALTNLHEVVINTNLSFDARKVLDIVRDNHKKIRLNATFHPLFADFKKFIENALLLQKEGIFVGAMYLAWPGQVKDIPQYRKEFSKRGFKLCILTFWGEYEGRKYPDAYTQEEKDIISPNLGERSGENFQMEPMVVQGKLCNAGHTYAIIHPDGKALRCGGGSWEREDSPLGNLFDDVFSLLPQASACTSRYCPCNEWAFLLVEK